MTFLFIARSLCAEWINPGHDWNAFISAVAVSFSASFKNINCVKLPNSISYYLTGLFSNTDKVCLPGLQ